MAKKQTTTLSQDYWTYPDMTKALEIALYYGFTPAPTVEIEKSDRDIAKHFQSENASFFRPEEKIALLRSWFENGPAGSTVMVASSHTEHRHGNSFEYSLDVLGTNRSIADATLIKVAYETVRAEGYEDATLEINTIGDRESFARYNRELSNFFKKHANELHAECRQLSKKNIFDAITCSHDECREIKERMPAPMNYLSEPSRVYFMELLELLETTAIPYNLNNALLANTECAMHTMFRIMVNNDKKSEAVAYGARWGVMAKKMGFKKDIQGMSATVLIKRPEKQEKSHKIPKPKCYFIQMGNEAKLKSLRVIEVLRQSKIPVYHSLTKDKLTAQLMSAENLNVPYVLIMGQKESVENTILIREMRNRSQETIKVDQVCDYLKKIIR